VLEVEVVAVRVVDMVEVVLEVDMVEVVRVVDMVEVQMDHLHYLDHLNYLEVVVVLDTDTEHVKIKIENIFTIYITR
jgi:hypothetical protein